MSKEEHVINCPFYNREVDEDFMDKRFEEFNIRMPLFTEEANLNGMVFNNEAMSEALAHSKNTPIIDYRDDKQGVPIGIVPENLSLENDFINGKCVIWDKYLKLFHEERQEGCLIGDIEYNIIAQHKENDVVVIDKLNLNAISINGDDLNKKD